MAEDNEKLLTKLQGLKQAIDAKVSPYMQIRTSIDLLKELAANSAYEVQPELAELLDQLNDEVQKGSINQSTLQKLKELVDKPAAAALEFLFS